MEGFKFQQRIIFATSWICFREIITKLDPSGSCILASSFRVFLALARESKEKKKFVDRDLARYSPPPLASVQPRTASKADAPHFRPKFSKKIPQKTVVVSETWVLKRSF